MGEKTWVNRTAGSIVGQGIDEPNLLVFGEISVNDVIRVPQEFPHEKLRGKVLRVKAIQPNFPCPVKGHSEHTVSLIVLEEGVVVYECGSMYYWGLTKPPAEKVTTVRTTITRETTISATIKEKAEDESQNDHDPGEQA